MTTPKEAIEQVFQDIGGQRAFGEWAQKHPTVFYTQLYPRLLPLTIDANHKLEITLSWLHSRPVRPELARDITAQGATLPALSGLLPLLEDDAIVAAASEAPHG